MREGGLLKGFFRMLMNHEEERAGHAPRSDAAGGNAEKGETAAVSVTSMEEGRNTKGISFLIVERGKRKISS